MLKLKTTSSISGVPEPLPEASRSPNQKPWKKSWKTYMHSSGIQKLTCRSSTKFFSAGQKRKEEKKQLSTCRSRAYYLSAGQKYHKASNVQDPFMQPRGYNLQHWDLLLCFLILFQWLLSKYQLPACNTTWPAKSKMAAIGPQNGQQGLEWGLPQCYPAIRTTFAI